jgi:hypothetical protein
VTVAILDDHLLRDVLAQEVSTDLSRILREHEPATTNLYYLRLCKSAVSARGGALTGSWPAERRQAVGRQLLELSAGVHMVPMRHLAFRMAQIADVHPVSTLGAEAVAAAEHLDAPLCVWSGDVGPHIRAAAAEIGATYRIVSR